MDQMSITNNSYDGVSTNQYNSPTDASWLITNSDISYNGGNGLMYDSEQSPANLFRTRIETSWTGSFSR